MDRIELGEAALIDGALPFQLFRLIHIPLMMPSRRSPSASMRSCGVERVSLRPPAAVARDGDHAARRAGQLPIGRRFAVGTADDGGLHLRPAAGRDLIRLHKYMSSGLTAGAVKG